ncbi:MAG: hypothetical protein M3178_05865 [Pseudomonadota bacterium]|nr:hypothetical protein [Pseudomonadota bacterium]
MGDFCRWVVRSPPTPKLRNPIPKGLIPSLDRAIARVSRAEEHLADFVRKVAQRGQEQIDAITFNPDPNNPQQFIINQVHLPMDFSFSILIGEIVYNIRSALDYLVFELAGLDSGYLIEGTQFPIEDKKKGFKRRIQGGWLDGLNSAHIAAIEALQPYRGCDWTAVLKNLSNPDKHVHLVPSRADHEFTFHGADANHVIDFRDMPGAVHSTVMSDGTEVYVKAMLTTSIQFPDGTPVIETLEILKSEVARVLEAFKPDFERAQGGLHNTPSLP